MTRMVHWALLVFLVVVWLVSPAAAEPSLAVQEQAAFKAATAAVAGSVVQVRAFGGLDRVDGTRTGTGPGSAVVLTADGFLMSSAFLFAAQPAAVLVTLPDGSRHDARVVATDHARLLTLLKIDAAGLTPPTPADAAAARVGEWTLAVGKAFDPATPNASAGVLSAKDRIWGRALQTDCKTSPFNYGGPLIDLEGRVLGLLTPLSMTDDGVMAGADWYDAGIGFAVPFDQVLAAFERMRDGTDLHRGTLGLALEGKGPFAEPVVGAVKPDGPAAAAGLEKGDRIVTIDGRPIARQADIQRAIGPKYAGDTVAVTYRRGDAEGTAEVTLAQPPTPKADTPATPAPETPPGDVPPAS